MDDVFNEIRAMLPEGWSILEGDFDYIRGIVSPDGKVHLINEYKRKNKSSPIFVPWSHMQREVVRILNEQKSI